MTLFVSATLLFLVQPMIAKMILPKFGGTPAVWNTCMVFFQAALLAGYAYAHATPRWLGIRRQALVHLVLLVLPFIVLPIAVSEAFAPRGDAHPIPQVLGLLVLTVGLPFFVVSTSAPLLQKWFADTGHASAKDPYYLYAASNLGSMIALLGYPILVEPFFALSTQGWIWTGGYALFAVTTGTCALLLWRSPVPEPEIVADWKPQEKKPEQHERGAKKGKTDRGSSLREAFDEMSQELAQPTWGRRWHWIALAFVPSSLMLGVTTYLTTDIAAIPLLWVIPLTLYLLSFILVFSTLLPPSVHRALVLIMPVLILLLMFMWLTGVAPRPMVLVFAFHLVTLFVVAMVCHGELARTRPPTVYLTEFYLWMSLGGVLGGLFNALLAPLVFTRLLEYPIALVMACLLLPSTGQVSTARWNRIVDLSLPTVLILLAVGLIAKRTWDQDFNPGWMWQNPNGQMQFVSLLPTSTHILWPDQVRWTGVTQWVNVVSGKLEDDASWSAIVPLFMFPIPNAVALLLGAVLVSAGYIWYRRQERLDRALDIGTALALGILTAGIVFRPLTNMMNWEWLAERLNVDLVQLNKILTYGLPALFCYVFVERSVRFGLCVGAFFLAGIFCTDMGDMALRRERSFFGTLMVYDDGPHRKLLHGTTLHGMQYIDVPQTPEEMIPFYRVGALWGELSEDNPFTRLGGLAAYTHGRYAFPFSGPTPLTYYHADGPLGQIFRDFHQRHRAPPVAVIGLGTGTVASYGEKGQVVTYYEIDPAVEHIARDPKLFTYISDAEQRGVRLRIVLGDARLQLARETEDPPYGLIVVDAFSSDAIPVHLITQEALRVYLDKLAPDGIVAFHISNRYLDLQPVLARLAKEDGLVGLSMSDYEDKRTGKFGSHWIFLARQDHAEQAFGFLWRQAKEPSIDSRDDVGEFVHLRGKADDPLWTDKFSNLLSIFNWGFNR